MINLKKLRESHGIKQEQLANMLCLGLRQYQRCEDSNFLSKQASKILALIIKLNKLHGNDYLDIDCLNVVLTTKDVNKIIKIAKTKRVLG